MSNKYQYIPSQYRNLQLQNRLLFSSYYCLFIWWFLSKPWLLKLPLSIFLNVDIFHFFKFVYIFLLQFFFSKTQIIRYIEKHSIFKTKRANFRLTRLKVTWLFVLHYPTIFIQTEMKTLVMLSLSLSLSVSLSFNHYTVLLYL